MHVCLTVILLLTVYIRVKFTAVSRMLIKKRKSRLISAPPSVAACSLENGVHVLSHLSVLKYPVLMLILFFNVANHSHASTWFTTQ